MQNTFKIGEKLPTKQTLLSIAVATAMFSPLAAHAAVAVHGTVAGTYFTAPVISDNPANAKPSSTVASVYQNAKVCFDKNNNGACDSGEASTTTNSTGSFSLLSPTAANLVAEISSNSTNNGNAVSQRTVFRVAKEQIAAATTIPANITVTPISTEVLRSIENDGLSYAQSVNAIAGRLNVTNNNLLSNPASVSDSVQHSAIITESNILTNRWTLAAKMVDRGDLSPTTNTTIKIPEAQETALNLEGIPRYDHIFIIMLENKGTNSIKNSPYAPKINSYLTTGNQFVSYFATGNPSEPNYTALGGADDFGLTDDSQWNCGATGSNAIQDTFQPTNTISGLASSPFTAPCSSATNHNIVGKANLFNTLTKNGLSWRTYSESMNPGQDFRTDSVAYANITAADHVYQPGTLNGNTTAIGSPSLLLPLPAGLYKTKHHPGMAYQNVRSAPEFLTSNRTLGGGQWDSVLLNSNKYTPPAGYIIDQFSADLLSGDVGNLNFVIPDQCDDMHGITVNGVGGTGTASDCTGSNIITRGDNYTDKIIQKIQTSPLWTNSNKRVAVVIMFDEGTATSGFNGCCGWNPHSTSSNPLIHNADGTYSIDSTITNYNLGNRGHGESIFGLLTNQAFAPKGLIDSDYYSHFSFVRTLQDMFGLSDPKVDSSYMNRSKYTETFIAANLLNLPEYSGSADTHFDSVRPMNHAYTFAANATRKQSSDITTTAISGPDNTQTNLWALHN